MEALAHNRDCKIIWAHMGVSRRVDVKDLAEIVGDLLKYYKLLDKLDASVAKKICRENALSLIKK